MDVADLLQDALAHLGVRADLPGPAADAAVDLTLELDGVTTYVELKRRSLVDAEAAARLLGDSGGSGGPRAGGLLLVVGDRVTEEARRRLLAGGAGYLDLRGHLALRATRMVIDADVPAMRAETDRTDALAGKAGLEVAAQLLLSPNQPAAVRVLARELGRSPSTVSEVLAALRRDGLVDSSNAVVDTRLFWRLAERWPHRRTYAAAVPDPDDHVVARALRLGLEDLDAPGWALTDTAAAAAYGAPVAFRAGQQLDFLVHDESALQRAIRLLGGTSSAEKAMITLRVAPVRAATAHRIELGGPPVWPLVHPLFVALDLAQDTGRGREILDAWHPGDGWTRVW